MASAGADLHIPYVAPDAQAPTEYLKHPGFFATTETGRLAPPMIASGGSKGEDGPKSITKPVFFEEDCHVIVVPTFVQKSLLPFAFGMSGVAEAEEAVLLTSTVQGADVDPHVLSALHSVSGCGSEQAYLLLACDGAVWAASSTSGSKNEEYETGRQR